MTDWLRRGSAVKEHVRGTHRTRSISQSLLDAKRLASRAGVTRIANVTGLDSIGLPVVAVYRPNARSLSVSQGKGLDLESATTSGVMEAIESHHAEHMIKPLRLAGPAELAAQAAITEVERLPRLASDALRLSRALLWVEGLELFTDTPTWAPYEMVHTNYTLPLPSGSGTFVMSSNGLASGNHPVEAISHAICELVERDSVALWSLRGGVSLTDRRIAPDTVTDPDCRKVFAMLAAADVSCGVWDATSDIGLASFVCVIVDRQSDDLRQLYYATGSGCHPSREVALLRAVTEAVQCRLTYICGTRDDAGRDFFQRAREPARVQAMRDFVQRPLVNPRSFDAVPSRTHASCDDDLACELDCLQHAGITQVVAVDLTLPGFDLPVVRVVIPGLESLHDAPGYIPGARARSLTALEAS